MATAPSTLSANPLEESYARITGLDPMSAETGTAPISYGDAQFRASGGGAPPQGDIITIQGDPGTGATTAETWSHDIALENQRRQQLQFEYEQQQAEIANRLREQESARAEAQLGLSRASSAREASGEARQAGLYPYQRESARIGALTAAAELAPKRMAAINAERQMAIDDAFWRNEYQQGTQALRTPGYTFSPGGSAPWYTVMDTTGRVTSDPAYGKVSQQINPATGTFYQNQSRAQLLNNRYY